MSPVDNKRTHEIANLTNLLIYDQLPEGVRKRLEELVPAHEIRDRFGRRRYEALSENVGRRHVNEQIKQVITLLKSCEEGTPLDFLTRFGKVFPGQPIEKYILSRRAALSKSTVHSDGACVAVA